ncbi:hypothetical protein [Marinifilum sp.]|uniref:hypothetical protein n=1 Tax=Marinifilum sp. TaxID=2033137 RepID=UPI003BA9C728
MKRIKGLMIVVACLLTVNISMAITPEKTKIDKEKIAVLKKIQRLASQTCFCDFMEEGESESIVLRCTVNENNEVVVSKLIGFDEELKKAIRRSMERKKIKTTAALRGEELALRLKFEIY